MPDFDLHEMRKKDVWAENALSIFKFSRTCMNPVKKNIPRQVQWNENNLLL